MPVSISSNSGWSLPRRRFSSTSCSIRKGGLRIFVKHPHVGMRRRAVEIIVELLDVFAVIALEIGQPEQPFLQDRVFAVPQRKTEAQQQLIVAEAGDPVLTPAIGAAAGMVMRQVVPSVAIGAVIFAHRPPLPFAEIGSPAPPMDAASDRREPRRSSCRGHSQSAFCLHRLEPRRRRLGRFARPDLFAPSVRCCVDNRTQLGRDRGSNR